MPQDRSGQPPPEVSDLSPLTPHEEALYEAGKQMLVESVSVGREFCRYLVGALTGSVPVYLGLLKLVLGDGPYPPGAQLVLIALPCLLFITGALVAALGYFPKARAVSLDDMTALEAERNRNIRRRRSHAWVAMTLWAAGMVAGAVLLVGLMA